LYQNSNLSRALGSNIGKITIFFSFFNKFYHETKLMALLNLKDNYVFRIPKFWVLRVPPIQIPTQNGKMKILKFVNLKVSYKFRILNAILNSLVCNMMKVFTRPTSASDFFLNFLKNSELFFKKRSKICLSPSGYKLESWNFAWPCFARFSIKLHTQIWNTLEFAEEFS
jgi:hypothetical protein